MIPLMSETARSWLASVEGLPPEQIQERAVTAAQTGLLSFADALAIKALADRVSNSAKGLPAAGNVMSDMQQQIQSALAPQAQPTQAMAGGGIVAFQEGGGTARGRGGVRGDIYPLPHEFVGQALEAGEPYRTRGVAAPSISSPSSSGLNLLGSLGAFFGGAAQADRIAAGAPSAPPAPAVPAPVPGLGGAPYPLPTTAPIAPTPDTATGLGALDVGGYFKTLIEQMKGNVGNAPDLATEETAAQARYKGIEDLLKKQDKELADRGVTLQERTANQDRLLHAMLGFSMASAASQPGATFLGSAGAAGAEFAKNKMALNEDAAAKADALAESRLELERAGAQLGVDASEAAYRRYNEKLGAYERRQAALNDVYLARAKAESDMDTRLAAASAAAAAAAVKANTPTARDLLARDIAFNKARIEALQDPTMQMVQNSINTLRQKQMEGGLSTEEATQLQALLEQQASILNAYTGSLAGGSAGSGVGTGRTLRPGPGGLQ